MILILTYAFSKLTYLAYFSKMFKLLESQIKREPIPQNV